MPQTDVISPLNRLLHLMQRSFPAYSVQVRAVAFRGPDEMLEQLRRIVDEQEQLARQIADAILERKAPPDPGQFPIEFTSWNDVALPRVLEHAIELMERTASEAEALAQQHPEAPVFHFAREVVNLAARHVAQMKEALAIYAGAA